MSASNKFDARFDEVAGELYRLLQYLRADEWEYFFKETHVRRKIIRLLDFIDYGDDDD